MARVGEYAPACGLGDLKEGRRSLNERDTKNRAREVAVAHLDEHRIQARDFPGDLQIDLILADESQTTWNADTSFGRIETDADPSERERKVRRRRGTVRFAQTAAQD